MTPKTDHPAFKTVAFIGLGLIGGSLARLIRHQAPETNLIGIDPNPESLQQALDDGTLNQSLPSLDALDFAAVDLIILATHLAHNQSLLSRIAVQATAPVHVMDLGSTKATICDLADTLSENLRFIGGHPLAGREVSGYANSRWDLFLNKRFILCPCKKTPADFERRIQAWLQNLGTIPALAERHDHDRMMSLVSHFPQFYAVALANLLARHNPDESLHFLGGGIDDQMRLMASPHEMWGDIYRDNKAKVNTVLSDFIGILQDMQQALESETLEQWFQTSHQIHRQYQEHRSLNS